jgi:hypothetical protein
MDQKALICAQDQQDFSPLKGQKTSFVPYGFGKKRDITSL